jgi:hypothetical protein
MLLAMSVAHQKIYHFHIIDFLKSTLLGRTSSAESPTGNSHSPLGIQFRTKLQKINNVKMINF